MFDEITLDLRDELNSKFVFRLNLEEGIQKQKAKNKNYFAGPCCGLEMIYRIAERKKD